MTIRLLPIFIVVLLSACAAQQPTLTAFSSNQLDARRYSISYSNTGGLRDADYRRALQLAAQLTHDKGLRYFKVQRSAHQFSHVQDQAQTQLPEVSVLALGGAGNQVPVISYTQRPFPAGQARGISALVTHEIVVEMFQARPQGEVFDVTVFGAVE